MLHSFQGMVEFDRFGRPSAGWVNVQEIPEITEVSRPAETIDQAVAAIPPLSRLRDLFIAREVKVPPPKQRETAVDSAVAAFADADFRPTDSACRACGKATGAMCSPCGHRVWCVECGKGVGKVRCPICGFPVGAVTRIFSAEYCAICMDEVPVNTVLPCGHRCLCVKCAWELLNEKRQCPVCQGRLISIRHDFSV
jgi:hypothetical protein